MFDLTTAIFSYSLTYAAGVFVLIALVWQNRTKQVDLRYFLYSYLLSLSVSLLTLISNRSPAFIFMEAPLFVLSAVWLYEGLSRFTERPISQKHNYVLVGVLGLIEFVYTFWIPDELWRYLVFLIFALIVYGQIVWYTFWGVPQVHKSKFTRGIGYLFIAYILLTVAYAIRTFCSFARQVPPYVNSSIDAATLIVHQTLLVLLTFTLFLMINRRLIVEREQNIIRREQAEKALKESEKRFHRLERRLGERVIFFSRTMDGYMTYLGPGIEEILGVSPDQFIGKHWTDIASWLPASEATESDQERRSNPNGTAEHIIPFQHPDGTVHYIQIEQYVVHPEDGTPPFVEGVAREITAKIRAEQAIKESEARYRELFENTSDLIQAVSPDARFLYVNPAWKTTLGYSDDDIKSLSIFDVIYPEDQGRCRENFSQMLSGTAIGPTRVRMVGKSGQVITLEGSLRCHKKDGAPLFAQGIFRDITEQISFEQQLMHAATHDKLTNLPNRALFFDRLMQSIKKADRQKKYLAVLFVDLDGFKQVNDTHGHHAGDELLISFTQRLGRSLRKCDTAARLSGDEFALIFEDLTTPQDARIIAQKVLDVSTKPYALGDVDVNVTVSIGVSIYPDDAENPDMLLQRADAAMYKVKQSGKNGYAFFSDRYQHD